MNRRGKNSCGRSIVFAASWFAAHAPEELVVDSGIRRISLSGKNNGVNPLNCLLNVKSYFVLSHRTASTR